LTDQGRKNLIYKIIDDEEMEKVDGKTEFAGETVTISIRRSVHQQASFGDGRARMTLAHELAHGVMHYGAAKFRQAGATGATEISKTNAYESAEQAKVFAASLLIHDDHAATLSTPEEISEEFVVSLEAAKICFKRLADEKERAISAERVRHMNEEAQARLTPSPPQLKYLDEQCACGKTTLIPIGIKILCHSCDRIFDRQDGDELNRPSVGHTSHRWACRRWLRKLDHHVRLF
jgi:hypothetical protein